MHQHLLRPLKPSHPKLWVRPHWTRIHPHLGHRIPPHHPQLHWSLRRIRLPLIHLLQIRLQIRVPLLPARPSLPRLEAGQTPSISSTISSCADSRYRATQPIRSVLHGWYRALRLKWAVSTGASAPRRRSESDSPGSKPLPSHESGASTREAGLNVLAGRGGAEGCGAVG